MFFNIQIGNEVADQFRRYRQFETELGSNIIPFRKVIFGFFPVFLLPLVLASVFVAKKLVT